MLRYKYEFTVEMLRYKFLFRVGMLRYKFLLRVGMLRYKSLFRVEMLRYKYVCRVEMLRFKYRFMLGLLCYFFFFLGWECAVLYMYKCYQQQLFIGSLDCIRSSGLCRCTDRHVPKEPCKQNLQIAMTRRNLHGCNAESKSVFAGDGEPGGLRVYI